MMRPTQQSEIVLAIFATIASEVGTSAAKEGMRPLLCQHDPSFCSDL
jgi:hypothetical protein